MSERPENYESVLVSLDDQQRTSSMRFQFEKQRLLAVLDGTDENGYRRHCGEDWSNLDIRRLILDLKKRKATRKKLKEDLANQ